MSDEITAIQVAEPSTSIEAGPESVPTSGVAASVQEAVAKRPHYIKDRPSSLLSADHVARLKAKGVKKKYPKKKVSTQTPIVPMTPDTPVGVDGFPTSTPAAIVPVPTPEPKKDHLWKPGQSGNLTGRPKTKHFTEAINRVFGAPSKCPEDINEIGKMFRLVKAKMVNFLENDDEFDMEDLHLLMQDLEMLAKRTEGQPAVETDDRGAGGHGPLIINIGTRFTPKENRIDDPDAIDVEVVGNGTAN